MKNNEYISFLKPQEEYYKKAPYRDFSSENTMYQLFRDINQNNLEANAVGYMNHHFDYESILSDVDKLANALKEMGVKENDVVFVAMVTTPEVSKLLLAINKIGAVSKWVDIRVKAKDLEHYINEHESKYVVVFDMLLPMVEEVIDNTDVKKVIVTSPVDSLGTPIKIGYRLKALKEGTYHAFPSDKRFVKFNDLLKKGSGKDLLKPVSFDKEKPSLIVQSSGTTGKAKAIVHTDFTINESVNKLSHADLPFDFGNRLLVTVPPWVAYGLINSYYLSIIHGMEAVLCPKVDADTVFNSLGNFDVSFAAPLHYRYLVDKIDKCPDLSNIKALITGGDKITVEELKQIKQILGTKGFDGEIINGYGNNECLGAVTANFMKHNCLGSVGVPLYGNTVAAFDENNQELKINEEGELCFKTTTMFKEYVGLEKETDEVKQLHDDNCYWIHSKDLGYVSKEGYVFVTGRLCQVINRRAFKIAPETIEAVIKTHYAVDNCVVVGVYSKEEVSVPYAHIVFKEEYLYKVNYLIEEIKALCEANLKDYEVPVYYDSLESIPYTPNNKVDFKLLEKIGNEAVLNKGKVLIKK